MFGKNFWINIFLYSQQKWVFNDTHHVCTTMNMNSFHSNKYNKNLTAIPKYTRPRREALI